MRKIGEWICEWAVNAVLSIAEFLAAIGVIHDKTKDR
jgi:hypothetical protein